MQLHQRCCLGVRCPSSQFVVALWAEGTSAPVESHGTAAPIGPRKTAREACLGVTQRPESEAILPQPAILHERFRTRSFVFAVATARVPRVPPAASLTQIVAWGLSTQDDFF